MRPLFPFVCLLGLASAFHPPAVMGTDARMADALRGRLVTLSADNTLPDAPEGILTGKKLLAFYFSAGWCPPCHVFTPKLAAFYRQMRPTHPEFEIVFISADHSEEEMRGYMRESAMPWPALRFPALKDVPEITALGGEGVPQLVLVDAATGRVLSASTQGNAYVGPERVLVDLQLRLAGVIK